MLLLASAPGAVAAQEGRRSLAFELGFSRDSATALGGRVPVALSTTWWLTGDLDASARGAWTFEPRPAGRAADASFEGGAGLRYAVATWGPLRAQALAEVAFVQVLGVPGAELWASDSGVRAGGGAALELFFSRDLSLSFVARASHLALFSGGGGPSMALALGVSAYF